MSRPERRLSLLDCIALGINGIIGSGIYLQVSPLAQRAGPASVLGVLACGLLCSLVGLCFAELSGMFDRSGGSYLYTRAAFGPQVGFAVGWMSMANGVLGFSAVAVGFAEALLPGPLSAWRVGGLELSWRTAVAVALICALGAINYLGVRAGARTMDLLSVAKIAPLLLLALGGLFSVKGAVLARIFSPEAVPASSGGYFPAVLGATFLAVFMLSGFEYTSVPAGEVRDARRVLPLVMVGSLLGSTLLYCVLMLVAHSVLPDVAARVQPLPDTAAALVGPWGGRAMNGAALVSMAGFCAGSALVGPRYFTALAEDGFLPASLARYTRFGTPGPAILASTAMAVLLALLLGFSSLVDISIVALFLQYIPSALAVPVLRRRLPDAPRAYRLPGGALIPALATLVSVALLVAARPGGREWWVSLEVLAVGVLAWGLTALARRRGRAREAAKPAPPTQAG